MSPMIDLFWDTEDTLEGSRMEADTNEPLLALQGTNRFFSPLL